MSIEYKLGAGELEVAGITVKLPYPVTNVLEHRNRLIVQLEPPALSQFDRNIYAISPEGKIIWQVEQPPRYGDHYESPFRDVWISDRQELLAWTAVGATFAIDPVSGAIELRNFERF